MDKAINVPGLHEFLSNQDAREIHESVLSTPHEEIVLDGKHAAGSVLLVHGSKWSVNSKDDQAQNFVVDVDMTTDFLTTITPMFGIYGLQAGEVVKEFEAQMGQTAKILAEGKNIYDVNFDTQGHPDIRFNSVVPAFELQN